MSLAKDMIEAQRNILDKAGKFVCGGCEQPSTKENLGSIRVYEPQGEDPEPALNAVGLPNLGVYMLCNTCARSPWSKIRMSVVKYLAKAGLFTSKARNR